MLSVKVLSKLTMDKDIPEYFFLIKIQIFFGN